MQHPLRIWIGLALLFTCGVGFGVAGTLLGVRKYALNVANGGPPAVRKVLVQKLRFELKLRDDQVPAVTALVEAGQNDVLAIRNKVRPEIEAVLETRRAELRELLDDEQRARLEVLHNRMQERWK